MLYVLPGKWLLLYIQLEVIQIGRILFISSLYNGKYNRHYLNDAESNKKIRKSE